MAVSIPPPPAPAPGRPGVLLFDPDQPWREALAGALRERGLAPAPAATLEEARWRLHERRPDLLILSTAPGNLALESLLAVLNRRGAPPPVLLIEDRRGGGCPETWRFLRAARTLRRPCRVRDVADAASDLLRRAGAERQAGA